MAVSDAFMSLLSILSGPMNPSESGLSHDRKAMVPLPDRSLYEETLAALSWP